MEEKRNINVSIVSAPEKSIPKFCTGIGVNKLPDGNVVIAFFNQSSAPASNGTPPLVLIETIILNKEGIKNFAQAFNELINEEKKI